MKIESNKPYFKILTSDEYTTRGGTTYIAQIEHSKLSVHRTIKDKDEFFLRSKVQAQFDKWEVVWQKTVDRDRLQNEKLTNHASADALTKLAKQRLYQIENILNYTLTIDDRINWDSIKSKVRFEKINPNDNLYSEILKLPEPKKYRMAKVPDPPTRSNFIPYLTIWDKLFSFLRQRKIVEAEGAFQKALAKWQLGADEIELDNNVLKRKEAESLREYEESKFALISKTELLEKEWVKERNEFLATQKQFNDKVDVLKQKYNNSDPEAIIQHSEMVLNASVYPDSFP